MCFTMGADKKLLRVDKTCVLFPKLHHLSPYLDTFRLIIWETPTNFVSQNQYMEPVWLIDRGQERIYWYG